MDIRIGDRLAMKKPHPCSCRTFLVLRTGMDLRLRCEGCGHELILPRAKLERSIKTIIREEEKNNNV